MHIEITAEPHPHSRHRWLLTYFCLRARDKYQQEDRTGAWKMHFTGISCPVCGEAVLNEDIIVRVL